MIPNFFVLGKASRTPCFFLCLFVFFPSHRIHLDDTLFRAQTIFIFIRSPSFLALSSNTSHMKCAWKCIKLKPVVEWLPKRLNWISFALRRKLSCWLLSGHILERVLLLFLFFCSKKALDMGNNNNNTGCGTKRCMQNTKPSWLWYRGLKTSALLAKCTCFSLFLRLCDDYARYEISKTIWI